MRFRKRTLVARGSFTRAGRILRQDREELFELFSKEIEGRLRRFRMRRSGHEELSRLSKQLSAAGIYSPFSSVKAVELSVMKRLYKTLARPGETWASYVRRTVGDEWFQPGPGRRSRA